MQPAGGKIQLRPLSHYQSKRETEFEALIGILSTGSLMEVISSLTNPNFAHWIADMLKCHCYGIISPVAA